MSAKISLEVRGEYNKLKEELKLLKSQNLLDELKNKVLEQIIFKELPKVCTNCGETKYLTLDHLVPESLLMDLSVFDVIEDNYQILCRYCNYKKSNRLDMLNPKTREILLRIIK